MKKNKLRAESIFLFFFFLFLTILFLYVWNYHTYTQKHKLPDYDGNRHIAIVSNFIFGLTHLDYTSFDFDKNSINLFSYFYLALSFFIVGIGNSGFAFAYLVCLVIILFFTYSIHAKDFRKTSFSYLVLLLTGIVLSNIGGVFDLRLDFFSVTACIGCVSCLLQKRILSSIIYFFIAALFKGAAFFLLLPILIFYFLYLTFQKSIDFNKDKTTVFKISLILLLGVLFFYLSFWSSINYNLMGAGGKTTTERISLFFINIKDYFTDYLFYYNEILSREYFIFFLVSFPFLKIINLFILNRKITEGFFLESIGFILFSYLLLTANPLHSNVLIIWLLPSIFLFIIAFTEDLFLILKNFVRVKKKSLHIAILFGYVFLIYHQYNYLYKKEISKDVESIFFQTKGISEYLKKEETFQNKKIVFLSNFASSENQIPNYSDTYRALVQKEFSIPPVHIEADEFVSFEGDYWDVVFWKNYFSYDEMFLLLQENPEGTPSNHRVQKIGKFLFDFFLKQMKNNPSCFTEIVNPIFLDKIGERKIVRIQKNTLCINSLLK
jgi:hypothetical protein